MKPQKLNKSGIQKQTYLESIGWRFKHDKDGVWYFEHSGEYCKMDFAGTVKFLTTAEKETLNK